MSPGSIQLYYHHSKIAFLCLFRENICNFQSHASEISDSRWKGIPGIQVFKYLFGAIFKEQHLHYSFKSIPNSCYGDGCCYGLQKGTWQQRPLTSHPPLRWQISRELTFSLSPAPIIHMDFAYYPSESQVDVAGFWHYLAPWHEKEHNGHKHFLVQHFNVDIMKGSQGYPVPWSCFLFSKDKLQILLKLSLMNMSDGFCLSRGVQSTNISII